MTKLNMVKALNVALQQEMERDPDVLILGEDVGVDGGVFRVTDDLQRQFGSRSERCCQLRAFPGGDDRVVRTVDQEHRARNPR